MSEILKIPSREIILDCLRNTAEQLTVVALAQALRLPQKSVAVLERRVLAMCKDELLRLNKRSEIVLNNKKFIQGLVSIHPDGFGFVTQKELKEDIKDDIFLPASELSKVMHGDLVHLKRSIQAVNASRARSRGRHEYKVIEIIKRGQTQLIGKLELGVEGEWQFNAVDRRLQQNVKIEKIDLKIKSDLRSGMVVVGKIVTYPDRFDAIGVRLFELLGDRSTAGIEVEMAVRRFSLPYMFSKEVLALGNKVSRTNPAKNKNLEATASPKSSAETLVKSNARIDLRGLPFVTIDGADARDFDDAVYCAPVKIGARSGYRLYVAIADVSDYVHDGDALDTEARLRSTSVYFPQQVIPMLPESLSNGVCSLMPAQDRKVLVCEMDIDANGLTQKYEFYCALIHSQARLTYDQVAAVLRGDVSHFIQLELIAYLKTLKQLSDILLRQRDKRGALNFEMGEVLFEFDDAKKVIDLHIKQRNDAHRVIEECMLAANVCAANYLQATPSLFRVHEAPDAAKIKQLLLQLKLYGITGVQLSAENFAQEFAQLTKKIAQHPLSGVLTGLVLRTMKQALYSAKNKGHFGLGYDAYTHFTSPIRRYPDLLVHRAIKAKIERKKYRPWLSVEDEKEIGISGRGDLKVWEYLGQICSERERRADEAVRDVTAYWKCFFMKEKIGMELFGRITSVVHYGVFVHLNEWDIQGVIAGGNLESLNYQYDESRLCWFNKTNGKRLGLGLELGVCVAGVSIDDRKINFQLL